MTTPAPREQGSDGLGVKRRRLEVCHRFEIAWRKR